MIARLLVLLPYHLAVPEGEEFPVFQYEDRGHRVSAHPPRKSDRPTSVDGPDEVRLDGVRAIEADVLQIDFQKDAFDRREEILFDPPLEVIRDAINWFLARLRYAARAPQVRPVDFPLTTWRTIYLNDDGTELPKAEGLVRRRGGLQLSFSYIALNGAVWRSMHELPANYEPPPWEELLLDAQSDLPRIGPALVLAATALEVFIARKLDELASLKALPSDLWTWINDRGPREPTVEEQYDGLLRFFTGHSLKSEEKLWGLFMNLKTARNRFVHEGVASVGTGRVPLSVDDARKLVDAASNVVSTVREWLPEQLHWPVFRHQVRLEATHKLRPETPKAAESEKDVPGNAG
jgi:hypothetical protein